MEKFPTRPNQERLKTVEQPTDLETLKNQLRAHIRDNVIQLKELREKASVAQEQAGRKIQEAWQKGLEGEEFRGEYITDPKQKAWWAVESLKSETKEVVFGHGVASNRPTADRDFPINALVSILATGIVKGDNAPLSGGLNQVVFTDAPFILLSNRGEHLTELDANNIQKLKGLRTVLVNGQYEGVVDDLRKAFPWVSFRTASEIDDSVFEKKEPDYKSYEDKIQEMAEAELKKRKGTT